MLNVYKVISENVSVAIATNGENVTKQPLIKSMRTVKKEALKLISSWVGHSNDPQMVSSCFRTCCSCWQAAVESIVLYLAEWPVTVKHCSVVPRVTLVLI